jgi:protein required for attachment to host cells
MYQACIAIVDASRARLFVFERSREAEGLREQMSERHDLVNPARRLRPSELFSDDSGVARSGPLQYGFDDHRDDHVEQIDAQFAATVIAELESLLDATRAPRLIVCASPKMLGALRTAGAGLRRRDLQIDELPRDLVQLGAVEIRERLAAHDLLPPRPRFDPAEAARP